MKIGFIADTHLGAGYSLGKEILVREDDREILVNSRLLDFYESFRETIHQMSLLEVTQIIHLGDVFKTKNPSSIERYYFSLI